VRRRDYRRRHRSRSGARNEEVDMGKLARRNAEEKLLRGEIPIRIGRKERAKDRKAKERQSQIWLPVTKKEAPLTAAEQEEVFASARQVKAEVASGKRPAGVVDLGEVGIPEMSPEMVGRLADVVFSPVMTARRRFRSTGAETGSFNAESEGTVTLATLNPETGSFNAESEGTVTLATLNPETGEVLTHVEDEE
jgi:hypothetical protein